MDIVSGNSHGKERAVSGIASVMYEPMNWVDQRKADEALTVRNAHVESSGGTSSILGTTPPAAHCAREASCHDVLADGEYC